MVSTNISQAQTRRRRPGRLDHAPRQLQSWIAEPGEAGQLLQQSNRAV